MRYALLCCLTLAGGWATDSVPLNVRAEEPPATLEDQPDASDAGGSDATATMVGGAGIASEPPKKLVAAPLAFAGVPQVDGGVLPQTDPVLSDAWIAPTAAQTDLRRFDSLSMDVGTQARLSNDFTALPDFDSGVLIVREDIALKIGGYVKADLIYDMDAIDSTDTFDTTTILTSGPDRKNARFHARQSRLSFDTRWMVGQDVIRAFVEADFFGGDPNGTSAFRLRHAYGSLGQFTAGQTWTTFTDPSAVPQTLDFEGAVSSVNRRQGLVRLDQPLFVEGWSWAIALEDPRIILEDRGNLPVQGRTESPDLISRLRLEREWGSMQAAVVLRSLGFQPPNGPVVNKGAWGINFAGSLQAWERSNGYFQVTFGEGIGSYRGSPDVVQVGPNAGAILPMFGWMVGVHHEWADRLTSNFTFSQLALDDLPGQNPANLLGTTYLAINLIANPYDRVFWGVEYLYGLREDVGGARGDAQRIQTSFGFYLP